jgi:hypothetical protein
MLSIYSILKYIKTNLTDPRYKKLDEEHIMDSKTGIEIHMYDDWFKITKGDDVIATMGDFTPEEQECIWEIKQEVADPIKSKAKEENYYKDMYDRRSHISMLFESPEPIKNKEPIVEPNTEVYKG